MAGEGPDTADTCIQQWQAKMQTAERPAKMHAMPKGGARMIVNQIIHRPRCLSMADHVVLSSLRPQVVVICLVLFWGVLFL